MPELPELAHIGRDTIRNASTSVRLTPHAHETMELCFVERGAVWWCVGSELHEVSGGHAYVTWPHELHGGLHGALNPCKLYWLGVDLRPRDRSEDRTFLDLPESEAAALVAALATLPRRHFPAPVLLARLCDRMVDTIEGQNDAFGVTRLRATLLDFLVGVIDAAMLAPALAYSALAEATLRAIDESLDRPLSVHELAQRLGWSPSHVQHRFRKEVGVPLAEWQLRRRIGQACRLLERTDEAIMSIGSELGFSSSQYFATAFRRVVGLSPTAFRNAARAGEEQPAIGRATSANPLKDGWPLSGLK